MCVSVRVCAAEESHLLLTQYSEPSEEGAFPFVARGSLAWLRSPGNVVVPHAGDPRRPHHAQSWPRFRDSGFFERWA